MEQEYIPVKQAMEVLDVSRFTLYALVRKGVLKTYSVPAKPGQTLFSVAEINDAMKVRPRDEQEVYANA